MENFKEIAEKCLAGELSGTFKLASGESVSSYNLERLTDELQSPIYQYRMCVNGTTFLYTIYGTLFKHKNFSLDIINFIPDNMQKKIEINIPEGKVPVMEQTESGVVITWKEKELTYEDIANKILDGPKHIPGCFYNAVGDTTSSTPFYRKVNALRKLTNIRNYFGKPKHNTYGHALYYTIERGIHTTPALYPSNNQRIIFDTKEHAEQAIKMLGDELKYLFEPW